MFVNFHEMYKTTKAIRFVAARFLPARRNKGWINGRSIIIMRICCTRLIEQALALTVLRVLTRKITLKLRKEEH